MKKLVLLFVMAATVGLAKAELPLALGLKFGYVNSKYTIQNIKDFDFGEEYTYDDLKTDTKNGFQFGAMSRVKFGDKFFLQPEAYYAMKKGSSTVSLKGVTTDDATVTQNLTLQNLDVPILLSYKLLDLKLAQINVFAGPMASFVMNKDVKVKSSDNNYDDFKPEDTNFKNAQWNAQFGVGVDVLMLSLDVRYEMGLSSATKGYLETKSDFLTFSLAWRIFG